MPVILKTPLWSIAVRDEAMQYGAHSSAEDHKEFLRNELADMVEAGHWLVLPYSSVRHATDLRISPLGVVPQRDRRPRPIVDYTFSGVNEATVKLAPPESMQFGKALDRIIQKAAEANPRHGIVNLSKYDLADAFMRVGLAPSMILKLAVAVPTTSPDEDPLIAVPMVLPMGWMESPPAFCTVTETIADLANAKIAQGYIPAPYHRHEAVANTMPEQPTMPECLQYSPDQHTETGDAYKISSTSLPTTNTTSLLGSPNRSTGMEDTSKTSAATLRQSAEEVVLHPTTTSSATCPGRAQTSLPTMRHLVPQATRASPDDTGCPPLEYVDVFMDDFILLTQGPIERQQQVRRILLECIDSVIRPLDHTDRKERKEAASVKKLLNGDGCQMALKTVLGWLLNTEHRTVQLPESRVLRLNEILKSLPKEKKRVSKKIWYQVLGELRSMVLAIPGGRGLFSALQRALRRTTGRIRLTQAVHDELDDWRWLTRDIHSRPTSWDELVEKIPAYVGSHDAARYGMGGVWFGNNTTDQPTLWRQAFPPEITTSLVTYENPQGTISNSDLELAGHVAHNDVLASLENIDSVTVASYTDNTPALYWTKKGSTSTSIPAAYLLRLQALHQRHYCYHSKISHIAGTANVMADDCSRLWHLTDEQLLTHFNLHYPQNLPWKQCTLRPEMNFALLSALQRKRQPPESFLLQLQKQKHGGSSGWQNVPSGKLTQSKTPVLRTLPTTLQHLPTKYGQEKSPRVVNRADLETWKPPYVQSDRRLPYWGPTTTTHAYNRMAS